MHTLTQTYGYAKYALLRHVHKQMPTQHTHARTHMHADTHVIIYIHAHTFTPRQKVHTDTHTWTCTPHVHMHTLVYPHIHVHTPCKSQFFVFSFFKENVPYFQSSGMLQQIEYNLNDRKGWKEFLRNNKCTVYRKQLPSGIYEYRGSRNIKLYLVLFIMEYFFACLNFHMYLFLQIAKKMCTNFCESYMKLGKKMKENIYFVY